MFDHIVIQNTDLEPCEDFLFQRQVTVSYSESKAFNVSNKQRSRLNYEIVMHTLLPERTTLHHSPDDTLA